MEPTNQETSTETQSSKGGVMLSGLKRKRDFYMLIWVFHVVIFPFFWISCIVFFHPYLMYVTIALMVTGFASFFLFVKYDNDWNDLR